MQSDDSGDQKNVSETWDGQKRIEVIIPVKSWYKLYSWTLLEGMLDNIDNPNVGTGFGNLETSLKAQHHAARNPDLLFCSFKTFYIMVFSMFFFFIFDVVNFLKRLEHRSWNMSS